ncbi:iron-sulfur cluster repair protein YtfE [Reyranella sp.]|uniref:iron-sulfur cluster repair protein YtfE n=1 Tax=Reyranella sp. TaxID=1929291 RepID=UPI003D112842
MTTPANDLFARHATVGEIAAALPGATDVFRRFGMDFCCKGNVALEDSARQRGVDVAEVERALSALGCASDGEAVPTATTALIDHIVAHYHETHRRELPELIRLAQQVEKVHAGKAGVPAGLAALLERMASELEQHMCKEELILFPAMRLQGGGVRLDAPIACMRHEHDDHGEHLRELDALTNGITLPPGACRTWQALYAGLAKLNEDLMQHIHLENNVLFPRFST